MELLAIMIAVIVVVFGGPGFSRQLAASPTISALKSAPDTYGLPRVIAGGVILVIILYHLTN